MTLEAKTSLEKQTLIDKIIDDLSKQRIQIPLCNGTLSIQEAYPSLLSNIKTILQKHLPQEDTYQKTTVPNVLLYETGYKEGYQKGKEDMKKEIRKIIANKWKQGKEIRLDDIKNLLFPTDTK